MLCCGMNRVTAVAAPSLEGALLPANVAIHKKSTSHAVPACTVFWCSYHVCEPVCGSSKPQDQPQLFAEAFHPLAL